MHLAVGRLNAALSPHTLPWLAKTFGHLNPSAEVLLNLAVTSSALLILSMTLIPALERLFIRDLIRRGEREGRKIQGIRENLQFKVEKKIHAR